MRDRLDRFFDLTEAMAHNLVTKQHLVARVVARRIEFEAATPHVQSLKVALQLGRDAILVDAGASQDARQFLYVPLRVACVDPECMQLQKLARIVLVQVSLCVLRVV